jgi:hypothetical protein
MKMLKICKNRMEAEAIIQNLKEIGVIAMIKAVPSKSRPQESELHLLVDDHEIQKAKELLKLE